MRWLRPVALLALLLAACSSPPPRAYGIGHPIPLGPCVVSVEGSDLSSWADKALLTVHFQLQCSSKPAGLKLFFAKYHNAFSLRDGDGKKYDGLAFPEPKRGMDPASMFEALKKRPKTFEEMMANLGMDPDRWSVMFVVPAYSRGFSLHIENRAPQSGQPSAASVDLYR
jgi:hypothetical protein